MRKRSPRLSRLFSLQHCKLLLVICWFAGLISGIAYSHCMQPFASLMRGAASGAVSIVGLGAVLFLPYLLTVSAVLFSRSGFLFLIAFSKAFSYAVCATWVEFVFQNSGWMIRFLLLFSASTSLPVLLWLWFHCIGGTKNTCNNAFYIAAGYLLAIGIIDYAIIAPFLNSVL